MTTQYLLLVEMSYVKMEKTTLTWDDYLESGKIKPTERSVRIIGQTIIIFCHLQSES